MHRRVHPGHLPPCHPADAAGDGRHHRLRHWPGDAIISQKKRRPGRESPSGPSQSQHFQRTVLYYRLFSNSANIFRLRTIYVPIFRPVRSAPHSRMGHGLVREERQKQTAPKSSQKWKKAVQITWICTAVSCVEKKDTRFLSSIILDTPLSTYPSWVLYYLCFFSALDFNPVSQDSKIGMIITVETNSKNFKVGESLSK